MNAFHENYQFVDFGSIAFFILGLSGITVYCILLWTESLEWLQISQFFYALYMATEVAYYSYMYAKVT